MRFLDFHTHPWRPQDFAAGTIAFITRISPAVREHGDLLEDPRFAAGLLRDQGAMHAVLLAEHCPATSGDVRTETVLDLAARSDGFFLPFASVDPVSDADAAGLLHRYVQLGVRGLKLYPSYQFWYPNDERAYPLYEICQAARIPVLMHIGSSVIAGTRLKYCDPLRLDDIAVDFPDLTFVMAHGGRGFWYDECAFLAMHHRNFHIDLAGLVPGQLREHFPRLDRMVDKLVFGSDWPAMPKSPLENARALAALELGAEALEKVLWRNAARLLGVDVTAVAAS